MDYDSARGKTVLFGGYNLNDYFGDTWEWDGAAGTWTQRATTGPPARYGHGQVYDSARRKSVLFGGSNSNGFFGDTWEWDGAAGNWTQRAPITSPWARYVIAGIAYDSARRKTVLFGGSDGNNTFDDTWDWDSAAGTWTSRTSGAPSARWAHGLAYDSARGKMVLFGGRGPGGFFGDTWEWNAFQSTWTLRAITGPPARYGHAIVYDSARRKTVVFGGSNSNGYLRDTWEWDGDAGTWTQRATTGPSARSTPGLAYDSARGKIVLFGGQISGGLVGETWEWDGTAGTWTQRSPASGPSPRYSLALDYDSARARTVLFGGFDGASYLGDTWEWDGAAGTWTQRATTGPSGRYAHGQVYDSARRKSILFGGSGSASSGFLGDTWEWDGAAGTWTQRASTGPSARWVLAGIAYDSARARTVLFGGYDNNRYFDDTWEWDGAAGTWTQPAAPALPDLVPLSFMAPGTGIARQSISVSWTVQNQGAVPAFPSWYDDVILSTTPTGSGTELASSNTPQSTALAVGGSYTVSKSVTLPAAAPGSYFLIFRVNHTRLLTESNYDNNNRAIAINVTAPDLVPTAFTAPATASTQQPIAVSWTVKNQGTGDALPTWNDDVILSTTPTGSGIELVSSNTPQSTALAVGGSYTVSKSVTLPAAAPGSYYLIFRANHNRWLTESNYGNNDRAIPITLSAAPDLVPTTFTAPAAASTQQPIAVSWTVQNQGTVEAFPIWNDDVILSTTPTGSGTELVSSDTPQSTVAAGASYTVSKTVALPAAGPGSYYLILRVNYSRLLTESNYANNNQAIPITITAAPDLVATGLTGPSTGSPGQSIPVSFTIKNQGAADAFAMWTDTLYLSATPSCCAGATPVQGFGHSGTLSSGTSYTVTQNVTVPRSAGGNFNLVLFANSSSALYESDMTNNQRSIPITLTVPDLVATKVEVSSSGAPAAGQYIALSWTVTNQGVGTVWQRWQDQLYVSSRPSFDASATYLDTLQHAGPLAPGASYTATKSVKLPKNLSAGSHHVLLFTDGTNLIDESDKTNNVAAVAVSTASAPAAIRPGVALTIPGGASSTTRSPVFSPDGFRFAVADGNRVDVWRLDTLATLGTFTSHNGPVNSVSFSSPLGEVAVSASVDGMVKIWDSTSMTQIRAFTQPEYVNNPAVFSADGKRVLAASNNVAKLWDAQGGALLGTFTPAVGTTVKAVALSPDGTKAVTGSAGGSATLWNVATFAPIAALTAHSDDVRAAAFSPDGTEFLTGSNDGSIRIWDAARGTARATLVQGEHVVDARYSADGQYIVSCDDANDSSAYLFQRGGVLAAVFQSNLTGAGHPPVFSGVAISPDRTILATTYSGRDRLQEPIEGIQLWTTGLPAIPVVTAVPVTVSTNYAFTIRPHGTYLFEFTVDRAQPGLVINLLGTSNGATYSSAAGPDPVAARMFMSQGGAPSPLSHDDAADLLASSLTANVLASASTGGTYRVLVTAPFLTGGSIAATISANYNDFFVSSVESGRVGNAGQATIRIRGTGLKAGTLISLISPSSVTLSPQSVTRNNDTKNFATFDLTGAQPGAYTLKIVRASDSATRTVAGAINVTSGGGPALIFSMQGPAGVRKGRIYDFVLSYVNTGDADAAAPFVVVTSAEAGAFLYNDGTPHPGSPSWLAGADGWPSGVVPAGASGTIRFQASFNSTYSLTAGELPEDTTPFDWAQVSSNWPSFEITQPSLLPIVRQTMGSTYGQVLPAMRAAGMLLLTGPIDLNELLLETAGISADSVVSGGE